jgi:hypothetical protein
MNLQRKYLYRLPWSVTDNPGGWVEVTDACDLQCPGCYRHRIEGHRRLDEVFQDILVCKEKTNCDRMAIAGGEPLLYPHILDVVRFIAEHRLKPLLLTNGEHLTLELARELKRAGLIRFHFHVDSGQHRRGWENKNEAEMNALRQQYADLVDEAGGMQCGYNITVTRSTVDYLPDIIRWSRANMHKVHHLSLIAYRGFPLLDDLQYMVMGEAVDASRFQHSSDDIYALTLTSVEMYEVLKEHFPDFLPSTYLNGTADPDSFKFLVALQLGSRNGLCGYMGGRAVELVQAFHHLFSRRYVDFLRATRPGRKVFLLGLVDQEIRKAFFRFCRDVTRRPRNLFDTVSLQTISLQQPNEFLNGEANFCDGCLNMMMYQGKLIRSCRLDEYRIFGGPLVPIMKQKSVRAPVPAEETEDHLMQKGV